VRGSERALQLGSSEGGGAAAYGTGVQGRGGRHCGAARVRDEVEGVRRGHCGVLAYSGRACGVADVAAAGGVLSPCARDPLPIN